MRGEEVQRAPYDSEIYAKTRTGLAPHCDAREEPPDEG